MITLFLHHFGTPKNPSIIYLITTQGGVDVSVGFTPRLLGTWKPSSVPKSTRGIPLVFAGNFGAVNGEGWPKSPGSLAHRTSEDEGVSNHLKVFRFHETILRRWAKGSLGNTLPETNISPEDRGPLEVRRFRDSYWKSGSQGNKVCYSNCLLSIMHPRVIFNTLKSSHREIWLGAPLPNNRYGSWRRTATFCM